MLLTAVFFPVDGKRNRSRSLLHKSCCYGRVNEQVLGMPDRSARNLLGRIKDKRAYAPPKAVHGANSKAAVMPTPSRHDDLSLVRKSAWPPPGTVRTILYPGNSYPDCWRVRLTTRIPHQPSYKLRVPGLGKTSIERRFFWGWYCGSHANRVQGSIVLAQDKPLDLFGYSLG